MKNTQTPISNSIGNHEINIWERKDCSSGCFDVELHAIGQQIADQTAVENIARRF